MIQNTQVKVDFSLIGDEFSPEYISQVLSLTPTETYRKGEDFVFGKTVLQRKETCWSLATNYEESLDINIQLDKVIVQLEDKIEAIIALMEKYNLITKIFIVIYIKDDQSPAMYFHSEKIDFFQRIRSNVEFDLYVV
ncbi:DUF4279 domain-containing protein [Leptospira weilii]|uniref:DUF4279 domain-containing protein n=1 Tax=Leptospira weilii TaxID=28184 RepID=UPI000774313D|nr:DUF4279 domain-containing protein [Leptospira weilii]